MVYSTGMQPAPPTVPVPLSQFQTHRWGNVQVLQIFSRLFSTHSHTPTHTHNSHTLTTTTEMSSLCFNEMCVACVRNRNARRRRRRAAEGAVRQRCCCHLKNCAQKYATVCRAFNINTIYVALTSFYFFFFFLLYLPFCQLFFILTQHLCNGKTFGRSNLKNFTPTNFVILVIICKFQLN